MNAKETQLEHALTQLRARLLVMGASVEIAVEEACVAVEKGDAARARAVVEGDEAINRLENEIDDRALSLMVRNQPVAQDLRFVVGTLRMVIDFERIGDEAASMAEQSMAENKLPEEIMLSVRGLMQRARACFRQSLESFRFRDIDAALKVIDIGVDNEKMEEAALRGIIDYLNAESPSEPRSASAIHGALICHSLSRICRRSVNIARHVYFIIQGSNIKHQPSPYAETSPV